MRRVRLRLAPAALTKQSQRLTGLAQKYMAHILLERDIGLQESLPRDCMEPIKTLWQDSGVKAAIAKGNEYALHDNLA